MDPLKLLVQNGLLITLEPETPDPFIGWLVVGSDGRIAALGPGDPEPSLAPMADTVLDVEGSFVAPGFVSAHSHLFTSGFRGIGADQPLYGWGRAMNRYLSRLDTEDVYWLTRHGSLDFLNNGVTTAYDFTHGRQPFEVGSDGRAVAAGEARPMDYLYAQLDAKAESGIRFVNSVHLDDHIGGVDGALARLDQLADYASRHHANPRSFGLALTGSVQWSDTPETAVIEVAAMRRHGLINQAHFLETAEVLDVQRSKFAWYERAGALGPRMLFGHFVHPTDEMVAAAARAGSSMVWQPSSNGRLASGFADIPGLRSAGMAIGMGLDDQACTDVADPFQNLRVALYTQRAARHDAAALGVREVLRLHTLGSAQVLGIVDAIGSLAVGKYADFLVVDPRDPDIGPLWDPLAAYVLACGLRNLKRVYVGGDLVSLDGRSALSGAAGVATQVHRRLERLR